jgi:DNA-binding LacI/PurR family transcriptional regulator
MATIVDVAKKAGVSVSTVSYALSGVRHISEKTRQRILLAIEELHYHPNLLARGLINKRTKIIALLFPAVASDYLDDIQLDFISSIAKITSHYGYGLLLFTSPTDEQEIIRFIGEGLIDGILLMEVLRHDPRVTLMNQLGYPFSLIGHCEENDGNSFVDMDFYSGLNLCVEHLAKFKHRHIAFIPTFIDFENTNLDYVFESNRGFRDAVSRWGIHGLIQGCVSTVQQGYECMNNLLEKTPRLSAVIVGSEPIYSGVTQALQERGLQVPKDFSVVGLMSNLSAEKYTPKVTSLSVPSTEMGRLGAEFLIKKLENQEFEPQQVILPPQFTIRQSTGRLKSQT